MTCKVYVLVHGDEDGDDVTGVYATLALAQAKSTVCDEWRELTEDSWIAHGPVNPSGLCDSYVISVHSLAGVELDG